MQTTWLSPAFLSIRSLDIVLPLVSKDSGKWHNAKGVYWYYVHSRWYQTEMSTLVFMYICWYSCKNIVFRLWLLFCTMGTENFIRYIRVSLYFNIDTLENSTPKIWLVQHKLLNTKIWYHCAPWWYHCNTIIVQLMVPVWYHYWYHSGTIVIP